MNSAGTCPSASLSTTNLNALGAREILRCATNRLSQGTNQDFTNVNINYVVCSLIPDKLSAQ
jgi:hypothetical protein